MSEKMNINKFIPFTGRAVLAALKEHIPSDYIDVPSNSLDHWNVNKLGRGITNSTMSMSVLDFEEASIFRIPSGDTYEDGLTMNTKFFERLRKQESERGGLFKEFLLTINTRSPVVVILGDGTVLQYWSTAGAEEARVLRGKKVK